MTEIEITKEIFTSFAGTMFALLSAGIVWLLKSALDKHKSETVALAIYERGLASNLEVLYDNFDFLDQWIDSLKNQNRPYSAHFEPYIIDDQEHYKISDVGLINQIIQLNYKLRRSSADLGHLQKGYLKTLKEIDSTADKKDRLLNLSSFHQSFVSCLEPVTVNRNHLEKEILKAIARIRLVSTVRRHSLFSYLSFLFKDVWPRATQKHFEKELDRLQKDVEERKKLRK